MRGNAIRRQVAVYAGIALALAVAIVIWFVFTQRNTDQLLDGGERMNILLFALDSTQVVDLITLVSLSDTDLVLFSFPTDLRLGDSSGSFERAGELYQNKGEGAVTAAIGDLLGMEIPFYLSSDYSAIEEWIDALGGVEIVLQASAIYMDSTVDPAMRVEIRPGNKHFDGPGAIAFASSPSAAGDIGLIERQQALLRALLTQIIETPSVRTIRNVVRDVSPALETNLSLSDLLQVAEVLHQIPPANMRANRLAGEIVEIDGVTYTQPRIVETELIAASLLKGFDLLTPADVNVAVFNGSGIRLIARRTADYLRARGFRVTGIGNADSFDYETSYIIVLTDEAKAWVLRDALPSDAQIVFPETFEPHYQALRDFIPAGTDVAFIAGAGLEIE